MANERQFDRCKGKEVDHLSVRGLKDDEGKEVSSYFPSWLELRWSRPRFNSLEDPGFRFALLLQNGDALRPSTFLGRLNGATLPAQAMAWLKDHAPEGNGKPARPYIGRDGRRLNSAARCFLPRHDPTVIAGMNGLIMVEEFHFPTMERLMAAKFADKSFADKERRALTPREFERTLYVGVDISPREDGTLGPFGFVLIRAPHLRDEGEHVRVLRDGAVVYIYPEALATIAEVHAWASWELPAALVDDEEETKLLPASTEGSKTLGSETSN